MTFEEALAKVLKHEGGYVDHPSDPGGATNYGITQAVARANGYAGDMRNLPMDLVKKIYKKQYWDAVQADRLPESLRIDVFDASVNSGTTQAAKWLQRACGAADDGLIGSATIAAVNSAPVMDVCLSFNAQRLRFLCSLPTFGTFGKGWVRRVCDNMEAK